MRLYLLPVSTTRSLLYAKRLPPPPKTSTTTTTTTTSSSTKSSPQPPPTTSPYAPAAILDKVTTRASATWLKWEAAPSGWQKTLTQYGNRAFERIAFEEWGLKSIPPKSYRIGQLSEEERSAGKEEEKIEVFYPRDVFERGDGVNTTSTPSSSSSARGEDPKILPLLRKLATERQALHKKYMWYNIIASPFMIPFALIPIIPNIPFFYVAWRAYSHWKALTGSQHLEFLAKHNLLQPVDVPALDAVYNTATGQKQETTAAALPTTPPLPSPTTSTTPTTQTEKTILNVPDAQRIGELLDVPEIVIELERAIRQVERAVGEAAEKVKDEAAAAAAAKEKKEE